MRAKEMREFVLHDIFFSIRIIIPFLMCVCNIGDAHIYSNFYEYDKPCVGVDSSHTSVLWDTFSYNARELSFFKLGKYHTLAHIPKAKGVYFV